MAVEDPDGPGVDALLPVLGAAPMLYDWDMLVRAKKEVAAANMMAYDFEASESDTGRVDQSKSRTTVSVLDAVPPRVLDTGSIPLW